MKIYAEPVDLARYITGNPSATADDAPSNTPVLLRSASILIRRMTARDRYDTNTDGYPTLIKVSEAFRDATCAMAAAYTSLGIDPTIGSASVKPAIASKSLGSASVAYAANAAAEKYRSDIASGQYLTPDALNILREAGLGSSAVSSSTWDPGVYARGPWPVS